MTWGYIGVAAVAAGTSYLSQSSAASGAAGGINDQNRAVIRQNKAIVESNIENTVRTGYRVGLLNMQQGQARKEFLQQGFDTSVAAQSILSGTAANAAAAGAVGSSVDLVQSDIQQKLGEAEAVRSEAWDLQLTNFNVQLKALLDEGKDALTNSDGTVAKSSISESQIITNSLIAGAASFASNYATRTMNLGLGPRPTTGTAPS